MHASRAAAAYLAKSRARRERIFSNLEPRLVIPNASTPLLRPAISVPTDVVLNMPTTAEINEQQLESKCDSHMLGFIIVAILAILLIGLVSYVLSGMI